MEFTAKQLSALLGGEVEGDPEARVSGFARIENGAPGKLCFFANPLYEKYVYTCKADILLVNRDFQPKQPVSATLVRVDDSYSAIARLMDIASASSREPRRHRGWLAVWHPLTSKIGRKVHIGSHAHLGKHVTIGDGTAIGENVTVGDRCRIGCGCILHPGVHIYPGTVIGNNVIIHSGAVIGADGFGNAPQEDGTWKKIEHLGNVIIGDNVEIGANTTVDRAEMESTVIGSGVKIDNLCQIAHNVRIGDNTVIAAQTGIAGSTKIGKGCIIAGQVGIVGHVEIADGTVIGAQAGVISSIREGGRTLWGTPAIDKNQYLRAFAKFRAEGKR